MVNSKYAGLAPIPALLASLLTLIVYFYPERSHANISIFDLPPPFSFAHSLFLGISALIVAYFFARGFLSSRSFSLVALGLGSLILGLGFLLSQILGGAPFGGPNQLTGISSLVFLFAGIFFGAFATLNLFDKTVRFGKPIVTLLTGYTGGAALVVVAILAVETKSVPDFFVSGVGPTLIREQVLGLAILLFSYSSIILMRNYSRSRDSILFWFSLGLASISIGFLSAFFGSFPGGPFSWLGRISLAVGGIYFLVAIALAYRGTRRKEADRPT
jgi:hypothetical protein